MSLDVALGVPAPNPFQGETHLSLIADPVSSVRVSAFDALGREVAVLHDGPVPPGATVRFGATGHAAWVYVVQARSDDGTVAQRVMTMTR